MSDYSEYLHDAHNEYGEVIGINYPIITVRGLPQLQLGEMVIFEGGEMGETFSLEGDVAKILLFDKNVPGIGSELTRTQTAHSITVGPQLLGSIIDPLGHAVWQLIPQRTDLTLKSLHKVTTHPPLLLSQRSRIDKQLTTGVSIVDLLLPLGAGQRELIVGDRKTGKSIFALTAAVHQARQKKIVIYAAIGQQKTDIQNLANHIIQEGVAEQFVIVATSAEESASLIYKTPVAALTIAEYFRDNGFETLVILDNLSTHAKMYRELALLARQFPGRDSYPADIFHIHASLLERAGSYRHPEKGSVTISCLPVAETVENDLTDYIVSNLISITDGHLLFDSAEFAKGRRPPISFGLSITRVGRQVQNNLEKELTRNLSELLVNFTRYESFSRFGSDVSKETQRVLRQGRCLLLFLDQVGYCPLEYDAQILLASLIEQDLWQPSGAQEIATIKTATAQKLTRPSALQKLFAAAVKKDTYKDFVTALTDNITTVKKSWPK